MQNIKDTYQRITDTIVEQLEAGTKPWIRPWRGNVRGSIIPRRATGEAYRGINVLMLWVSSQMCGYEENTWMTYRQARDHGGQVKKGEKGTLVVKYGTFTPKEQEDDVDRAIPYLKGYTVFNIEQIDHLPESIHSAVETTPLTPVPFLDSVETFIKGTAACVTYGGPNACYRPAMDDILMPARDRFLDEVHLYSTLLHELGHNADIRIMPTSTQMSRKWSPPAHSSRHNQRDSRKASSLSSGRYLPGFSAGAVNRASAFSLSRRSA